MEGLAAHRSGAERADEVEVETVALLVHAIDPSFDDLVLSSKGDALPTLGIEQRKLQRRLVGAIENGDGFVCHCTFPSATTKRERAIDRLVAVDNDKGRFGRWNLGVHRALIP
jgi:hypothetical protein